MSLPFISLCLPTYKRPELLKKLLDSIQVQTFKNFEVLISDNTPDDSIENLADNYKAVLPVSYIRNEPGVSAGENCVRVMRRARGEWIKVMHDDDWFASDNALQQFADATRHSGKDLIFSGSDQVWLDSDKKEEDLLTPEKKQWLDESPFCLFYSNVVGQPSAAMHRKDPAIEYDSGFKWVLDIDFYMRYLLAHPGYHYIADKLVNIGRGSTQETYRYLKNVKVELPEYFNLLAKYEPDLCLMNIHVFHRIWLLMARYKIKNTQQIREAGYTGVLPARLDTILAWQRYIPHLVLKQPPWSKRIMQRCFKKVTKKK
jgi:glycosyltransferase involved in cell wall biosynthesis